MITVFDYQNEFLNIHTIFDLHSGILTIVL